MSHQLARLLMTLPDRPTTVAGHGALAFVTTAAAQDGVPVVVLYVHAPEPEPFTLTPPETT